MPDTILDAVIRETERQRHPGIRRVFQASWVRNADAYTYLAERSRLTSLADRCGPKGALAGLLDDILRHG